MRLKAVSVVLLLLLGVTVTSRPVARADDPIDIVVEATRVTPEVLRAAIRIHPRPGRRSRLRGQPLPGGGYS